MNARAVRSYQEKDSFRGSYQRAGVDSYRLGFLPTARATNSPLIRGKASCTCGGGCPRCQAKSNLRISQPNDQAEREADAVADIVIRMSEKDLSTVDTAQVSSGLGIQRTCAACEEDEGRFLQSKAESSSVPAENNAGTMPPGIREVLNSSGEPLSREARAFFEPRFGRDFSGVRVHTGGAAALSARDVNAHAYTVGRNIVFGRGQYSPESTEGRRLIAHELTHVVQQMGLSARGHREEVPGATLQRSAVLPAVAGAGGLLIGTFCTAEAMNYADRFADDVLRRVEYDEATERWNINEGRDRGEWAQAMYDAWGHCYIAACMTRRVPEVVTWSLGTFYEVLHELLSQLSFGLIEHNSLFQDLYNQAVGREIGLHHTAEDLYETCFEAMMRGRLDLTLAGVVPRGRSLVPQGEASNGRGV